jgi:hypothetical protein
LNRSGSAQLLGVEARGIEPAGDLRDIENRAMAAYGIDADGALLVRPDGFVAWRRRNARGATQADLEAALDRVVSPEHTSRATRVSAQQGGLEQ